MPVLTDVELTGPEDLEIPATPELTEFRSKKPELAQPAEPGSVQRDLS
jgi:hypothetical protein